MNNINQQHQKYPLEFTGSGGEFFKIWIVNIMLSIVTLGIYSAWAKVRTKRYFYGNTLLMGTAFDYLGDPIKILKGRLIAFAVLVIYSVSAKLSPALQIGLTLVFVFVFPWIIIKALSFNAYNSAYRNIRFNFHATYSMASQVFQVLPILVAFSFGLAYPSFVCARKKFIIAHTAYGSSRFDLPITSSPFYGVYLKAVLLPVLVIIIFGCFSALSGSALASKDFAAITGVLVLPFYMFVFTYVYTAITNLVINNMTLENHRFESYLQAGTLFWLYFTNIIAITLSLGLLIPWAMIRTARYRISTITVCVNGSVDEFIAAETERVQAIGEEIGDMFDLDIGL